MKFDVNLDLLKKAKEKGHCLCDLEAGCPCDEFLEKGMCQCGVFKKAEEVNNDKSG